MKILVTGAAGFIGFHLSKSLLKDGYEIMGIDNMNDYYDQKLKYSRIKLLKSFSNFSFNKVDISKKDKINTVFLSFNPQKVVNLAAQAGVRYSVDNPYSYLDSNLVGFINIIDLCRNNNVEGLIYASSSSVYGENNKASSNIEDRVNKPISLYGATKRANELIAYAYSHLYGLNSTGLRYFTVYGPWGRPDMSIFIFLQKILAGESLPVYNNGHMKRDFSYIDDIILGTRAAIDKNYKCELFNLGNSKSVKLMDIIHIIEEELKIKANINFLPLQLGDPINTCSDISYSKKMLGFKPSVKIETGIPRTINWYKEYSNV